jgi:hypothetical protein
MDTYRQRSENKQYALYAWRWSNAHEWHYNDMWQRVQGLRELHPDQSQQQYYVNAAHLAPSLSHHRAFAAADMEAAMVGGSGGGGRRRNHQVSAGGVSIGGKRPYGSSYISPAMVDESDFGSWSGAQTQSPPHTRQRSTSACIPYYYYQPNFYNNY